MSKQTIGDGESGSSVRNKLNSNFTEIYNQEIDVESVILTDDTIIDITAAKHTLTTANSRTFTISFPGDNGVIDILLNAPSATMTFPSGWYCISEGTSSGDNNLILTGNAGDVYALTWYKVGDLYRVGSKNLFR